MGKCSKITCKCPTCGIERIMRADKAHRDCRRCSWNKIGFKKRGTRLREDAREKMSIAAKIRCESKEERERLSKLGTTVATGNKWNLGKRKENPITPHNKLERARFANEVRPQILKRDDYTCQVCKKRGCYLHVDHIKGWSKYPEFRFDLQNCRTLCTDCHFEITYSKKITKENKNWGKSIKSKK